MRDRKKRILIIWLIVAGCSLFPQADCGADAIYLNDGNVLKGLVVEEHHDRVLLSTLDGEKAVPRSDIDEIFFDALEQNYYYLANRFLDEGDFEHAEKFYAKALSVNPDYSEIRKGLLRLKDEKEKNIKKWKPADLQGLLREQGSISIAREDDFCVVRGVFREDSQLRPGDAITAVWDVSSKFMSAEEVAARITGIPGTRATITIERDIKVRLARAPWYFRMFGRQRKESLPLTMEPEGLTVGKLGSASSAVKSGLRAGDRIIAIEGASTRYMPLRKARALIHDEAIKGIRVMVRRDIDLERAFGRGTPRE